MPKPIQYQNGFAVNFRGPDGRRIRKRFPATLYPDPYRAALDFIGRAKSGPVDETDRLTEQVRQYLHYAEKVKHKAPGSVRSDTQRLLWFATYCQTECAVRAINGVDKAILRQFHEAIISGWNLDKRPNQARKRNNPHATWEKYRQIISAFFNYGISRGWVTVNPLSNAPEFRTKLQERPPEIFTHEELAAIFGYFDDLDGPLPWHGAFFRFLAYTGARMGEALSLTWRRVDFKQGVVLFERTKGRKVRSVPIHEKLLPWLKGLPKTGRLVFDNGSGGPYYTESTWLKKLYEACDKTGIPRRRLHDFRHTFCANIIMAGESLATMMELSGHGDYKTAKIYIHFYPGHRANAVNKIPY